MRRQFLVRRLRSHCRAACAGMVLVVVFGGGGAAVAASGSQVAGGGTQLACMPWARWNAFKRKFIDTSGRVVDLGSADSRTVSEGQAYGLFFALVANDRPAFEQLLLATQDYLSDGALGQRLPAWLWGRRADGTFAVLDKNTASDADLWIAYSLLQAGRLWRERRFTELGRLVAKRILSNEAAQLPGMGWTILPGTAGFHVDKSTWRLNPSYYPPQVLRGIAAALPDQPRWSAVVASSLRILLETAPRGFAPDWVLYRYADGSGQFVPDEDVDAKGSYNAIRVYLWIGMLSSEDQQTSRLLRLYHPMAETIGNNGFPPEEVNTVTGVPGENSGNGGFSAAVVPFLLFEGESELAEAQIARAQRLEARTPPGYYSEVLSLFGLGWQEGRFHFSADGRLVVSWHDLCARGIR